jgi:hypothetical protein
MDNFPRSALETKELARELVKHLKQGIANTKGSARGWTSQNLALLSDFCHKEGIDPIFSGPGTGPECLWDFAGYIKEKGILITVESEYNTDENKIAEDFDKLLYGNSPIKLMICRIDKRYSTSTAASEEANKIHKHLETGIKGSCAYYPPGSVFIIYCVWWAEEGGPNRDFPYILQIDGEPHYVSVRPDQHFQPLQK